MLLYGELLLRSGGDSGGSSHKRALMQEGGVLPGVGAAAAALPGQIRRVVAELADVHQVCVCVHGGGREGDMGGAFSTHTHVQKHKSTKEKYACKAAPPSLLSCGMTPSCPSCGEQCCRPPVPSWTCC